MRIRIIKEDEEQELKNLLKVDYPLFVKELGDNIKDPKFIAAIKSLSDKYPLNFKSATPKVGDLKPTQNEIDVDKSLKFPLTNADSAMACLKGGVIAVAGKRIITGGGGKFIIDGHHRYLASLLAGITLDRHPTNKTLATKISDWKTVSFVKEDWDTEAKIMILNQLDADYNGMTIHELSELLK